MHCLRTLQPLCERTVHKAYNLRNRYVWSALTSAFRASIVHCKCSNQCTAHLQCTCSVLCSCNQRYTGNEHGKCNKHCIIHLQFNLYVHIPTSSNVQCTINMHISAHGYMKGRLDVKSVVNSAHKVYNLWRNALEKSIKTQSVWNLFLGRLAEPSYSRSTAARTYPVGTRNVTSYAVRRSCWLHGTKHNETFCTVRRRKPGVNLRQSSHVSNRILTVDGRTSNCAKGSRQLWVSRTMGRIASLY